MKRGGIVRVTAGLTLAVSGVLISADSALRSEETVETKSCRVPISVFHGRAAVNAVVVLHGLSADRKLMFNLGAWLVSDATAVFVLDLPGHGDNPEPFSFARAEACAAQVLDTLAARGAIAPERTALLGHSMGGGIAIRLADRFPTAATVAISPGLGRRPRRMPANLLVVTGDFDLPQLRREARGLAEAAGGERTGAQDFAQLRAFELFHVPRATHTSYLFDPVAGRKIRTWLAHSLPDYSAQPQSVRLDVVFGSLLGILGLLLVFPAVATGLSRLSKPVLRSSAERPGATRSFVCWAVAGAFALAVLWLWVPLGWLRIYDGDYLVSYLFVAGLALVPLLGEKGALRAAPPPEPGGNERQILPLFRDWRGIVAGAVMGLAAMLAFGAWLDWWLYDLWLNAPRWWRFAAMLPFLLPYFAAEERALGPPERAWRGSMRRYALYFGLRGILAGLLLVPIFLLGNGPVLALLLLPYLALFSLLQRLGADALCQRTNSRATAVVFDGILAAWFVAGVMPIT